MQSSPAARKRNRQKRKIPAVIMSEEATQAYSQDSGQSFISILKSDFSLNFREAKLTNSYHWIEQWMKNTKVIWKRKGQCGAVDIPQKAFNDDS